ncbi:MAG: hypothetical protein AAF990_14400 [Bacteroidota bacterium]
MKRELEIAILSKVRLGASESRAKELVQYLGGIQTNILVINGPLYERPFQPGKKLPNWHQQVVNAIIEKVIDDTKVYFVSQRQETPFPSLPATHSSNILFREKLEFHYNKKKYLILPGTSPRPGGRYPTFSKNTRRWRFHLHQWIQNFQLILQTHNKPIDLSTQMTDKQQPKLPDNKLIQDAMVQGYDLLVCGSSYTPMIAQLSFEQKDITYMNAGDWLTHRTALEYRWNKWSIYQYHELDYGCISPRLQVKKSTEGQVRQTPSILFNPQQMPDSAAK